LYNVAFIVTGSLHNEYKFVFPAVAALVPLAAISLGALYERSRRVGLIVALSTAAVFLGAAARQTISRGMIPADMRPAVVLDDFYLRLAPGESLAPLVDAVVAFSPPSAILVTSGSRLNLVTLTRRPVYVMPESPLVHAVGLHPDVLLKRVRAYDEDLIDRRRSLLEAVYSGSDQGRGPAVTKIRQDVYRPLVLILELPKDTALSRWLSDASRARRVYGDRNSQAWLVDGTPVER
jgi:hypothetical protein